MPTVTRAREVPMFRCTLAHAGRLKDIVASAKTISDTIVVRINSDSEAQTLTYWADDGDDKGTRPTVAMVGNSSPDLFLACEGDDLPRIIQMPTKHFEECVKAFDSDRPLDIRLITQDQAFVLVMRQSKDDESDPDQRSITVQASQSAPVQPIIPKGAYAAVDLQTVNKVLGGLKKSTDIVQVSIRTDTLEISASTKRLQDAWTHATSTNGRATGLFGATYVKKAVQGALKVEKVGDLHLTDDQPLKITAAAEDLTATFYVAGRDVMK